ncbi:hypothetical protein TWF594_011735 [Orbilia oligospora]|uniref:F-box domain-containing protein n=1 Tax=Orbilia oligospora TaxID=2813651 RepID=A0A7C8JZQ1_ORBOL|nr:hypothetical protein TWF706_006055 [Orbilia oligospora]KAF3128165.1 hypothetical protein TWF594_011735 [Orbilia oligospora]KAF3135746.1 hypothetical protein TWF703_005840 [Orbilia oligospora]
MSQSPLSHSLSSTFSNLTLQDHHHHHHLLTTTSNPNNNPLLIPELLEIILTALPQLEVLTTCRSICTLWRDIIDTSPLLKYTTWRTETIPGRHHTKGDALRITARNYKRNPIVLEILSSFWSRLNSLPPQSISPSEAELYENNDDDDDDDLTLKQKKKKKKKKDPPKINPSTFLSRYHKICSHQIFSNSPPLDISIRITLQKYTTKHIIARSYRSISTDIGTGWITDLSVILNLMEEIVQLWNEGVYVEGRRNSLQAEIGWCVFLYGDDETGGKRRECEVSQKVDFECVKPWGVGILEGRVRAVG